MFGRCSEEEILSAATHQANLQKKPDAELAHLDRGVELSELCRDDPAELGHRPVMSKTSRFTREKLERLHLVGLSEQAKGHALEHTIVLWHLGEKFVCKGERMPVIHCSFRLFKELVQVCEERRASPSAGQLSEVETHFNKVVHLKDSVVF